MRSVTAMAATTVLTLLATAPAAGQDWVTVSKSRQTRGQNFLDVKLTYAVGRLELKSAPSGLLYRLNSRYDQEAFDIRTNYLESGRRGSLRIEVGGEHDVDLGNLKDYDYEDGYLRLGLTDEIPAALDIQVGAAEAELDLSDLRLQRLVLKTGASNTRVRFDRPNRETAETCAFEAGAAAFEAAGLANSGCRRIKVSGGVGDLKLDFSGEWRQDVSANVSVGLGGIEIRVPAEVGVRVDRSTFLMSFDAPGFEKQNGGIYLSRNWDTAKHQLTLNVSGALGGIKIARL